MRKIFTKLFVFAVLSTIVACTHVPELRSPCVGIEGSPCDRRMPANQA